MKVLKTNLKDLKIISHKKNTDARGVLIEVFKKKVLKWNNLVFDYVTTSKKNVLRGLHGDNETSKHITCVYGAFYLVVVDYREDSPNYLQWDSFTLDDRNMKSVLVPPGFLNGHLCLSDECVFHYTQSYPNEYVDWQDQMSVNWNDPALKINWPIDNPILSERDK